MAESRALTPGLPRRWLWAALIVGALARAMLLPLPGSPDVSSWKAWSFAAVTDPAGLYGAGGSPPERRLIRWQGIAGTTEYPPLALYELAVAGKIYAAFSTTFQDSARLTALIKSPGIIAEILFVIVWLTWGRKLFGPAAADWIAIAFWLNPAILLNGAALGYLDAQMAVPAALAVTAAAARQPAVAGALLAAGILTKAQAVFVAPIVLLAVLGTATTGAAARAVMALAVGGAAASALILLPILVRGAWANMIQAVSRLAAHDMLSGNALNAWWVVTWIERSLDGLERGWVTAFTTPVRILQASRFMEVGYPNPKPIGTALVLLAIGWGCWRGRRLSRLADWAFLGGWCVFAYAMFGAQVHENHLYLAVPWLAIAAGLAPEYRWHFWAVSLATAFNMYIFYGLSEGWPSIIGRRWTGVDLTVIAAVANLGIFAGATRRLVQSSKPQALGAGHPAPGARH